jgi:hypothetical protein
MPRVGAAARSGGEFRLAEVGKWQPVGPPNQRLIFSTSISFNVDKKNKSRNARFTQSQTISRLPNTNVGKNVGKEW